MVEEWVPMGFDISPISNLVKAEFVRGEWTDSLETQLFRIDGEGKIVMHWWNPETGEGVGLGNWFMCETGGANSKVILYWGIGLSPEVEDVDGKNCVKVEVLRS